MSQHEFLIELSENDVLSFLPRKLQGEKPEMLKVKLFREALDYVFNEADLEIIMNQKLEKRQLAIKTTFRECYGSKNIPVDRRLNWFGDGVDCEVLGIDGQGWKQGKVRLKVVAEFVADEQEKELFLSPESHEMSSELDEIRKFDCSRNSNL